MPVQLVRREVLVSIPVANDEHGPHRRLDIIDTTSKLVVARVRLSDLEFLGLLMDRQARKKVIGCQPASLTSRQETKTTLDSDPPDGTGWQIASRSQGGRTNWYRHVDIDTNLPVDDAAAIDTFLGLVNLSTLDEDRIEITVSGYTADYNVTAQIPTGGFATMLASGGHRTTGALRGVIGDLHP